MLSFIQKLINLVLPLKSNRKETICDLNVNWRNYEKKSHDNYCSEKFGIEAGHESIDWKENPWMFLV